MSILDEAVPSLPIHDALAAGLDVIGQNQVVSFVPYIRTVLPVDGFVFWLNASIATAPQMALAGITSAAPVEIPGSLHYASLGDQNEDETIAIRKVSFAAEQQISAFSEISPYLLYVGKWQTGGGSFKFTFSSRSTYYAEANIHHYEGDAVYPVFEEQLIDTLAGFDQRPVVSNSLPIWLRMFRDPIYPSAPLPMVTVPGSAGEVPLPLFPAWLVPDNLPAPYAAIEIRPSSTRALGAFPLIGPRSSHQQLCAETARLTFYGLRNDTALDFQDYLLQYSAYGSDIGIMSMPVMVDQHRKQTELAALAMKKTMDVEVSYLQSRARDIARELIQHVEATIYPSFGPPVHVGPTPIIPPSPLPPPIPPAPPVTTEIFVKLGTSSSYALANGTFYGQRAWIGDDMQLASPTNLIRVFGNFNLGSEIDFNQPGQAIEPWWDGSVWQVATWMIA